MGHDIALYVGIDPGTGGGIAAIRASDGYVETDVMPDTEEELYDWFADVSGRHDIRLCLERVGGFIGTRPGGGDHRNMAAAHTMFTFGRWYGGTRMALIATGLMPYTTHVTPQAWQKALGIPPKVKGETQSSFKNRIKARACEFFPGNKVTLKTADALCIAHYCRLIHTEKVK